LHILTIIDPILSYNQPAYAEAAITVLNNQKVKEVVVLGWSLGGHIGIEMLARYTLPVIKGLMIIGTPPVPKGRVSLGFNFGEDPDAWKAAPAARDDVTPEELEAFAKVVVDDPYKDWMLAAVQRTHPIARRLMFEGFARGDASDQVNVVEITKVPVAVINGANEPFVNLTYLKTINWSSLWTGQCIEMKGLEHAPFWGNPKEFQVLLNQFVKDCSADKEG
jgi:pimeloyl-ACP methyl ester carboxylesterase